MNKSVREKEAVLNVFAALMRPLMRFAFEYGISASEIAGVVRRTYIQALEARLAAWSSHGKQISLEARMIRDVRTTNCAGMRKDSTSIRYAV